MITTVPIISVFCKKKTILLKYLKLIISKSFSKSLLIEIKVLLSFNKW